jgi:mRNA interferase MazF
MSCKRGDVLLIKFPFTTLSRSKKRPVLVVKEENQYGDFVCFQITSKNTQSNICEIDKEHFLSDNLKLKSYVKYDKCFTLNSALVDKRLTSVDAVLLEKVKKLFCAEL